MCCKKTEKIIERQKELLINKLIPHLSEPSYYFQVGDCVQYAYHRNCIVKEVLFDGWGYVLEHERKERTPVGYPQPSNIVVAPWVYVKPISSDDNRVTKKEKPRLCMYETTVEDLLAIYYVHGIDTSRDYQKESIWGEKEREQMIRSIFLDIDTGRLIFNKFAEDNSKYSQYVSEIVYGKQKLLALIAFYEIWNLSYFVATVSDQTEAQIRSYIQSQKER